MPDPRPARIQRTSAAEFEAFYARHANRLRRAVSGSVRTPDRTIHEDACQHAWLQLARRSDITLDERGAQWLITVAIREGWRLARVRHDVPSGAIRGIGDGTEFELPEPASLYGDPEALALGRETHDQRAADLERLTTVQRRELCLQALGFSYEEIAEATGSTYTAVNRRISQGRAELAALASERERRGG